MKSLREYLLEATRDGWAIPHFNFTTLDQLKAIVEICQEMKSPLMAGTSESEGDFIDQDQAIALVDSYKKEGVAIFLNADHTRSVKRAKEFIDLGYDSIHIDLSKENTEDNIKGTKEIVDYAHASGKNISVEGELGYIPTDSSKVYKEEVEVDPERFTKPEEAKNFIENTGADRFAPAVGNLHGIAANEPHLALDLIKQIRKVLPENVALVLHGGSGISEKDFKSAIKLGFANVHISTEIRKAWKEALEEKLGESPDEYAPYRILKPAVEAVKKVVSEKIEIFGSANKA